MNTLPLIIADIHCSFFIISDNPIGFRIHCLVENGYKINNIIIRKGILYVAKHASKCRAFYIVFRTFTIYGLLRRLDANAATCA